MKEGKEQEQEQEQEKCWSIMFEIVTGAIMKLNNSEPPPTLLSYTTPPSPPKPTLLSRSSNISDRTIHNPNPPDLLPLQPTYHMHPSPPHYHNQSIEKCSYIYRTTLDRNVLKSNLTPHNLPTKRRILRPTQKKRGQHVHD